MAIIYFPQNTKLLERNTISGSQVVAVINVPPENAIFYFDTSASINSSSIVELGVLSTGATYRITSSWASSSISSSYAVSSSWSPQPVVPTSVASSSWASSSISSSYSLTSSYITSSNVIGTVLSSSFAISSLTSSFPWYASGSNNDILARSGSGKVGIGTLLPTAKLHISGSVANESLFNVANNASSILFISSSGNVGIGTITPVSNQGFVKCVDITNTSVNVALTLHQTGTSQEASIGTDGAGFYIDSCGHATATNNNIYFRTEETNAQNTPTVRMKINSIGDVGIGTVSPGTHAGYTTLAINSATNGGVLDLTINDAVKGELYATATSFNLWAPASSDITINPGAALAFTAKSTGLIDIANACRANGFISTGNPTVPAGTTQALVMGWYAAGGYAYFQAYNYNTSVYVPCYIEGSSVYINPNSLGKVGIRTITPLAELHVSGSEIITNNLTVTGSINSLSSISASLGFTGSLKGNVTGNATSASYLSGSIISNNYSAISSSAASNCGTVILSSGIASVSSSAVTATSLIFLTSEGGSVTNLGTPYISNKSAGVSFSIASTNILDSSTVAWHLINQI